MSVEISVGDCWGFTQSGSVEFTDVWHIRLGRGGLKHTRSIHVGQLVLVAVAFHVVGVECHTHNSTSACAAGLKVASKVAVFHDGALNTTHHATKT